MKKFLLATALTLTTGIASAAALNITGGSWDSIVTNNNNANNSLNTTAIYQGGDPVPTPQLGGVPNPAFTWNDDTGAARTDLMAFTGTIGGTITTDDGTGAITGGSLVITGTIGDQVIVGTNSWWLRIWEDVTIDLVTGASTVGSIDCARTAFAPANCTPGVTGGMPNAFNLGAGSVTPGGCYLPGATNDPANDPTSTAEACGPNGPPLALATFDDASGILSLFVEGRDAAGNVNGTDLQYEFSVTVEPIPLPAVAFLFPAGLIAGLGWMRRRTKV